MTSVTSERTIRLRCPTLYSHLPHRQSDDLIQWSVSLSQVRSRWADWWPGWRPLLQSLAPGSGLISLLVLASLLSTIWAALRMSLLLMLFAHLSDTKTAPKKRFFFKSIFYEKQNLQTIFHLKSSSFCVSLLPKSGSFWVSLLPKSSSFLVSPLPRSCLCSARKLGHTKLNLKMNEGKFKYFFEHCKWTMDHGKWIMHD